MKKILIAFLMLFTVFSCFSGSESDSSAKVVRLNAVSEGVNLDPQLVTDGNTFTILGLLGEGLTYTKASGEVIPALAKSWEVSEDGLKYTFHLRDDIKWSNGKDITADDFIYGWERALSPEVASEYAFLFFVVKNAEKYTKGEASLEEVGFKALDDKTIEVVLESPTPYFDSLVSFITFLPANREFVSEQGSSYGLDAENVLASGPYKVEKWDHNTELVLVKNENFYDKNQQKVDKYVFKYIADSSAALNAFKNEELDLVALTTEQLEEFKDDSRVIRHGQARVNFLSFATDKDLFKNKKIREGFALALDREKLVKSVFNDSKDPLYTFTPHNVGILGLNEDFAKEVGSIYPKTDVEKAKALIAEGLKELGLDSVPTLHLLADERGSNRKVSEVLQAQFQEVGVNVVVDVVTLKERLTRQRTRQFDMLFSAWGGDYQDPMTFLDLFITESGLNAPAYHSASYDNLIKFAKTTPNKVERINALIEAEKELARELPIVSLYQETQIYIKSDSLSGVEIGAIGLPNHFRNADKQ